MQAVVVAEPGKVSVECVPDPTPKSDEIVVRVRGCGICGTDLHIIHEGLPNTAYPLIHGHEPWGEVVEGLPGGKNQPGVARPGDLVAIDPSLHCGRCRRCRQGHGNLCENWGSIGGTRPGAWADYIAVPIKNIYPLGDDYPIESASLIEPVACAIRGMVRLQAQPDRSALIYGGGTMGVLLSLLLDLQGVGPITVVEANPRRREVITPLTPAVVSAPEDLAGVQMDYVIDATGNPRAIEEGLMRVSPGGTFMVFGVASPETRVPYSPYDVYKKEITIVGSMAILHTYPQAVEAVRRHADRFSPLLTHTYPLEQFGEALDALAGGEAVKVTIAPNGSGGGRS